MMKNTPVALAVLGIAAVVLASATPGLAKPPPAAVWEQFHFKDAKGHLHTITQQVQIVRADYAETACGADLSRGGAAEARSLVATHPEIAGMTFVSADCAKDKAGNIKVAVGS